MQGEHSSTAKWNLATTGIVAALVALAFVGTFVIRIPIPATTGYFNVGDVFVVLAGLWLGPAGGLVVGALGPAFADAIGFPQFILATCVTKGCEGLLVGLIGGGGRNISQRRRAIAASIGGAVVVVGYFVFEAFIYPALGSFVPFFKMTDFGAAVVEIGPNCVQGVVGAIVGLGLWRAVSGFDPRKRDSIGS